MNKCTPEKKKRCAKDCGPHLEFACKTCEANKEHEPSEWFNHIWFFYALQRGGYPFRANDLTVDEWMDLGLLKEELEAAKNGAYKD
ncbi:MAG TPA: hypothetical protein ACFYEK_09115 [Candidatus Wunengus sp. YC60]|uniref:hypothetical protein n=1 Tax=Candidatus Wunengus sp. YC60 TaxID=3367697 RepID=UPI0040264843